MHEFRGYKGTLDPLEPEVEAVVSLWTCVLRTGLGSFTGAVECS